MTTRPSSGRKHLATSPFQPKPELVIEQFVVGDRVSHDTYGLGRVVSAGTNTTTVDFNSAVVRISSPYLKMKKI